MKHKMKGEKTETGDINVPIDNSRIQTVHIEKGLFKTTLHLDYTNKSERRR